MDVYKVLSIEDYNKYIEIKEEKSEQVEIEKIPKLVQKKN